MNGCAASSANLWPLHGLCFVLKGHKSRKMKMKPYKSREYRLHFRQDFKQLGAYKNGFVNRSAK
jgi:hypothetical protein